MVEGIQRLLGLALVLMLLMSPSGAAPVLALPEAAPTSAQESVAVRVVASPDESFVHATSCSQADVQAAIDAANDGDTVLVPSGSCTWTAPVSFANKGITIRGAGIDQSIITDATSDAWGQTPFWIEGAKGKPFRITGFTFNGTSDGNGVIHIEGTCKDFRIDHCKIDDVGGVTIGVRGYTYGVIDHCTFTGDMYAIFVRAAFPGDASWQRPLGLGTADAVYIEDCIFDYTNGNFPVVDAQSGGRYALRHNVVNNSYAVTHGTESGYPERGTFSYEIYENSFTSPGNWFTAVFLSLDFAH